MIPLKSDNPILTFPLVTLLLILTNILIFTYQLSPVAQHNHFTEKFGANPAQIVSRPFKPIIYRGAERRLILPTAATVVTSMFLHGSYLHIFFNMLFLWIFGPSVEDKVGRLRFMFFYFLIGIIATLTFIAVNPRSSIPLIGASGAIAGIMGAYLMLFPWAKILCWFILLFRIPALVFLGLWIALQVWNAKSTPRGVAEVAWFAHIGGFLSGFLLIHLFVRRGLLSTNKKLTNNK